MLLLNVFLCLKSLENMLIAMPCQKFSNRTCTMFMTAGQAVPKVVALLVWYVFPFLLQVNIVCAYAQLTVNVWIILSSC